MLGKYSAKIGTSPYKSWFDACTCPEYVESNQNWIDLVDRKAQGISQEETEKLCRIFEHCASCENQFWDMLYGGMPSNH